MEIELLALCVKIVQNALDSPLGTAIEKYITERNIPSTFLQKNKTIIRNLKQNKYKKPEEFLAEYNQATEEFITLNDSTSDICIAVLGLQQQINDQMIQLISQEKSRFIERTHNFVTSVRPFLPNVPNDGISFQKLVTTVSQRELSEDFLESLAHNDPNDNVPEIHFDTGELLQLKQKIQCIDNDENLQKVGQIVKLNEENAIVTSAGNIEFDVFKCNKYTIKLIRDMIAHASIKVPPIPPSSPMKL